MTGDFGHPQHTIGGFLFSKGTSQDQTTQFAAATVTRMSSGLYFVDSATSIFWEHFFPTLAIRWYDLITHKHPVTLDTLRQFEMDDTPRTRIIACVGYPKKLSPYYDAVKPSWRSIDCPIDDVQLLSVEFHRYREYDHRAQRARLQFAHYMAHHDLVYANHLLQAAISLALRLHVAYIGQSKRLYDIETTDITVNTNAPRRPVRDNDETSAYVYVA